MIGVSGKPTLTSCNANTVVKSCVCYLVSDTFFNAEARRIFFNPCVVSRINESLIYRIVAMMCISKKLTSVHKINVQ